MIELELTDIAHGGVCVGHLDGRAVFTRFGLPGETVRVAVTSERSKLLRGDAVEVISDPSPHRVKHPWPVAGPLGVGGADLGHVSFDFQSEWKTHVLRASLRRVGGEELVDHLGEQGIEPSVRSFETDRATSGWHTRTRVEFTVDDDGLLAMFREGTHETVALGQMPLAVRDIDELDLFQGAWRSQLQPGERVRAVLPSGSDPLLLVGRRTFWAPGFEARPYVREDVVLDGELYPYRVHAAGFWQIHRDAGSQLIALVRRAADVREGDAVVELYSGAGLLTQPLALWTGEKGNVRSFEGARQAVEDARANLRDLPWASARTSRVDAKLVEWEPADVVVADPPRTGLGLEVAETLARGKARRIVLISCDPASMARDVSAMVQAGRKVVSMDSIDMFPNTHHFEVVTALS
ncbi:TRAM domain-containing protein [Actinomycetaceae bacterium L2_0104]